MQTPQRQELLTLAGQALRRQQPAAAFVHLTHILDDLRSSHKDSHEQIGNESIRLETETALRLRNYCAWLMGDWSDMETIIRNFKRARELQVQRENGSRSSTTMTMMAALCLPGGAGLRVDKVTTPVPQPLAGWVQIQVKAFGLNRTERLVLDKGNVFSWPIKELAPIRPLINGIECVGIVTAVGPSLGSDETGSSRFKAGTKVMACASSLGRGIDGTHAEYVVVPVGSVVPIPDDCALSWRQLAALPLSYGTAAGSLDAMDCREGDTVLIRGGTTALGLAAISLAKHTLNCTVIASSRRASSTELLKQTGADVVLVEPQVREPLRQLYPQGVDCVLECIGEATLKDSLRCVRPKGVLCQTGALKHVENFSLHVLGEIPSSVKVTCYESDGLTGAVLAPLLERLLNAIQQGKLSIPLDPTEFSLAQYEAAMAFLDSKDRKGKVVVTVP